MDISSIVAVAVPCVAVIFWFARLEGRINTGERLHQALRDDVTYIRERIDKALNGRDH